MGEGNSSPLLQFVICNMKKILLLALLGLVAAGPLNMTATSETAFGSVASSYAEKLSSKAYLAVDVVNNTNCDVQVRMDSLTGTPDTVVPAGTSETIKFGELGGYVTTTVSLQYMSGETCSSGSVYIKGIY